MKQPFRWSLTPDVHVPVTSRQLVIALEEFVKTVGENKGKGDSLLLELRLNPSERHELPKFIEELSWRAKLPQSEIVKAGAPNGAEQIAQHLKGGGNTPLVILDGESLKIDTQLRLLTSTTPFVLIVNILTGDELGKMGRWRTTFVEAVKRRIDVPPLAQREADWKPLAAAGLKAKLGRRPSADEIKRVVTAIAVRKQGLGVPLEAIGARSNPPPAA